jgi:hypothetical protein
VIRAAIDKELTDKEVYTTSFVLREFLRTVIADVAYVHSALRQVSGQDEDGRIGLERLVRILAQGHVSFSARAARREQYVIAAILESFGAARLCTAEVLLFLEMMAHQWIDDFFRVPSRQGRIEGRYFLRGLDESPDELGRLVQGTPIPSEIPFPARVPEFLQARKDTVGRLEQALITAPADVKDRRLIAVLQSFKNVHGEYDFQSKFDRSRTSNWRLGNLLIALEAPRESSIYTTDPHFNVLCAALDKPRYIGPLAA